MRLPASFTTVTPLSKTLAMIIFVSLPFASFYLGMKYQQSITIIDAPVIKTITSSPSPRQFDNNRAILTLESATKLANVKDGQCSLSVSGSDSGVEWKEFANSQVKFSYPYSSQWGNEQYQIMPIESLNNKQTAYFFGPMSVGIEGCGGAIRSYAFTIEVNKSLDDIKLAYPEDEIKSYQINNYPVIEYVEAPEMMSSSYIYFQNGNNLYRFDTGGNITDNLEFQKIIKSFQIL